MMPFVVAGIALLSLSILCMIIYYIYCQKMQGPAPALAYTTNNMNTMNRQLSAFSTKRNPIIAEGNNTLMLSAFSTKRNKSDTDLELIGRQGDAADVQM